ncbi:hypothetical protein MKW92_026315 [Papaver armeniacum]|nr:hypothetical protein MKW92_026315 [Papaver armeniacum]
MGKQSDKIRFNVGGKIFETTATTLASARKNSMFGAMFDDEWNLQPREVNEEYFIDRNPDCFSVLLDLLRTGEFHVPPHVPEKLSYREALYYGLLDNVRSAKWGRFDGNQLNLTCSVKVRPPSDWSAIRASPDGGCAIAHGNMVHVYNWMLEEHTPLNLDYQKVKDICWMDSENIVISSSQVAGGIGLFSSSTGDLRHRYQYYESEKVRGFSAGALCFNSDGKIFASCSGTKNGNITVWDQVTGKLFDFFEMSKGLFLGDAEKIQWLNESNCLFVSKLGSSYSWEREKDFISLLDFRDKSILCSRTSSSMERSTSKYSQCGVVDAIPMDQSYSVCVVDEYENLGFVDLRSTGESIRWNSKNQREVKYKYPKLAFHGGKLFCSMNDKISVYSGGLDEWVLSSSLERSPGGLIRDFSIGGDRLFALHSEENVFDVRLNVGGKLFETSATTLASARRDSMFGAMFDDEWNLQTRQVNQEYFIDRDPDCFSVLLNLLRTGELHVPPHVPDKLFYREALYYGLLDHVRTARICKFDCNWLKLKSSVRDQARDNWTAIRASPDGGCAVTHGGIVRVYDWMLEEHPPLNLGYRSIQDILWIDSENIVISSYQGGIGLFSSSTGHLKHRYQYYETDHGVGFAAGALCFNSDGKIFASRSWTNNCGIGVWDQVTGKQTDFFETSDGLQLGDADKIQWLNGRNCLFVSKFQSWREKNYISLLDFRDKSIVWSGTYKNCLANVDDAIPVDEGNSVCVASYLHGLGFLDLRRTDISTRWSDLKCIQKNHRYTPKLTFHGGQLFCSMHDKISVYYGGLDQWVLTSSLGRREGGSIRDFSIGGDRLFALHGEENVFDIWETPSAH